jgi:Na+/H+ antiporter NhaD/arsenite permease-like protein
VRAPLRCLPWLLLMAFAANASTELVAAQERTPTDVAAAETTSAAAGDEQQAAGGAAVNHATGDHGAAMGAELPLWSVLPFVALLLAIAVLPLAAEHWWHHNQNKALVALGLAIPVAIYLLASFGEAGRHDLQHKLQEYVSFILLLGALYVISGGIYVKGSLSGTPVANTGLLALGALLASIIGTTGASVLLIRPLLRANRTRRARAHIVVFFIFVVSNCGGLLTPLGDPPLFLGFLKGVPFFWTMEHLWCEWLAVNLALLALFHIYDELVFDREERARHGSQLEEALKHEPLGITGLFNFVLLAGIVATIYCAGQFGWPFGVAETIMALLGVIAYVSTPAANRAANQFTFGPIIEVAVLFIGIFITMAPALQILNAWGSGDRMVLGMGFGLSQPWHFFWATGILSSFLDNAPTYLTLAATAAGQAGIDAGPEAGAYLLKFLEQNPQDHRILAAISSGAVFMGANTYIGNGPNFMVKAIAEENGVHMPSFFGYMAYSGAILIPIFIGVTVVFFRS